MSRLSTRERPSGSELPRTPKRAWGVPVLTVVAVVLAVAFAALWLSKDGPSIREDGAATAPKNEQVDGPILSTSDWEPGDDAFTAGHVGAVAVTPDGCVHTVADGGGKTDMVWPAGWKAVEGPGGMVQVLDADGEVVAEEGDKILVGGHLVVDPSVYELSCQTPGAHGIWAVQGSVEVIR